MISLKCIYSETDLFERVDFHPGINIILGRYSDTERSVNGIGKSTLVRLIDFALLSSVKGGLTPRKNSFLKEHNVSLEINIDRETFVIKRYFENPNQAFFGASGSNLVEYSVSELKEILSNKLFGGGLYQGGYYRSDWFRDLMRFFIKDDLEGYRQDEPVDFLGYQELKSKKLTYNFFLLGLQNEKVFRYYQTTIEKNQNATALRKLESHIQDEAGKSISEIRTEIAKVDKRIARLEYSLEEFEFLENYQDIEDTLEKITLQISEKLHVYDSYNKTLNRYQESYSMRIEVDLDKIKSLYESFNQELGAFVKQTLDEVIQFRQQIADNRQRFLVDRERELELAITETLNNLEILDKKRKKLYDLLQERGALDSIRNTYEQLIEERVNLERTNAKLNQIFDLEILISGLKNDLSQLNIEIIENLKADQNKINDLRLLFKEILDSALFVDESTEGGYFDITKDNRMGSPANIVVVVPKSASLGQHRFSLLAYSLTVFLNIVRNDRNLPHFIVHDGMFHSIASKTIVNVLNYIYRQSLIFPNFQYIITGNEDEISILPSGKSITGDYEFDFEKSIIATYEAVPEKMIFGREY